MEDQNIKDFFFNKKGLKVIKRFLVDCSNGYDTSYNSFVPFSIDYVSDISYKKVKSACHGCGYGSSIYVLFKVNQDDYQDKWCIIKNWCGCQTYDPTYTFKVVKSLTKTKITDI